MKKKIFIAAAIVISSAAQAQNEKVILQDSSKELQSVIVTANKIEQKQNETGKVLTVISRQELQRSAGKTIGEVLNRQVGISIGGANGTLGTVQTIYTRGAVAANTLILLDGVPLYDASGISSEFDLNSFALDQVERIEILKGAQSTLYGSDAVAGVINIITKKPSGKKTLNLNLSVGSYNTWRGGINIGGATKKGLEYFAGYSKVYSDGFSSAYDSTGKNTFDDDGYKQDAVIATIGFKPAEKLTVKFYGKYNINKAQIDAGAFTDDKDYRYQTTNTVAGARLDYQLKKAALHLNYNFNAYERKYNNDSTDIGGYSPDPFAFYTKYIKERYKGRSHFVELYASVNLHKNVSLVGGADYRTNATSQEYLYISNYGPYEPAPLGEDTAKTSQTSAYASFLFNNQHGFTAGLGGRYNNHSVYGSNGTFSINPAYSFKRIKLFANVSSAYRVPSLYQLYSEYGNKELKPEQSVSYEAGVQYDGSVFTGRIVGFKRDIRDVFVFYTDAAFKSFYINEDKQRDYGAELEASATLGNQVVLSANYTYVDGEIATKDAGKDTTFSNLYRRPKNLFNASVAYTPVAKVFVRLNLRSTGSMYEPKFAAAPVQLSGYYTLDLYGEYRFNKNARIFLDLKNLTDQKYFDQEGFNTRRFNVNAGISLSL
jgi:vitamin B12 transporter